MKEIGIYIHIPFCAQKCNYCDFVSYSHKDNFIEQYVEELKNEIKNSLKKEEYLIKTIYIGGGTPSYINSKYIVDIINTIKGTCKIFSPCEITIEINPRYSYKRKII